MLDPYMEPLRLPQGRLATKPARATFSAPGSSFGYERFVRSEKHHDLKINGYSRSLNSIWPFFNSSPFRAGGRNWHISYRPKGSHGGNSDFISFYLALDDVDDDPVMAYFTLSLLDQDKNPMPSYFPTSKMNNFSVLT
jgi:hypothetical protein